MRVKRLEIQGFKSFKDKTVIHFDHGITGIVGPNGCGKSNIVDAFFWVMGEQSYKHMRGSSSDDLIFNGSSKYSPLGLAEATLVLETDFVDTANESANAPSGATVQDIPVHLRSKEVSVTRRLYRTGEGEYFINGVQARLKDIHELFMDTGVGAKGYSVIEQGQIGKIVNAKPDERRLLVEEAAGIAKYKARKKESLRKMEATQANLSRLNDVIAEIERSLNSLDRQAQKARQYKKYKDELVDKEMTWSRRKILVLNQKLEFLRKDREAIEQELVGLRAELQSAENGMETDRIEQLTDTKLAEELQERIQQFGEELARERSALELSKRRQMDLASQLQSLESEKGQLQGSITEEADRLASRETESGESDTAFENAAKRAQLMDEEVRRIRQEAEAARRDLDSTKRELMNGVTQSSDLTSRAASLLSRIESSQAQAEKLRQQVQAQADKLSQAREEASIAGTSSEAIRLSRDSLSAERRTQAQDLQAQEQKTRQTERERDDSLTSLTQLKSRLQSLEELASAYEGFGDGPRAVLEWARSQGVSHKLSALADALDIPAEYEAALGGWLDNKLENLVSQEAQLALGALEQLRAENQGRASIHVSTGGVVDTYNSIRFDHIAKLLENAGFVVKGELATLSKINPSLPENVREIASRAIEHVCIVESMAPLAEFVSRDGPLRLGHWSVVSIDGIALYQNGVLRGGSTENDGAASVLRRKRAIVDLQQGVAAAESNHQEAERILRESREQLDLSRARLQTLQADLQAVEVQGAAIERDVHQTQRAFKDAENHLQLIQTELNDTADEVEAARQERASIEGQLAQIISSRSELESRIATGETLLIEKDGEFRVQEGELQQLRVTEASLRERTQSLRRELEASRSLIADRERRLTEINRTLDRATGEQLQFTGGEADLEEKISRMTQQLTAEREKLAVVKDRLEQSSAKIDGSLDRIKELHHHGDDKAGKSNQIALELEKHSSDLGHLIKNLEEKYGPGCLERPVTSPIQEEMNEPVVTHEMTAEEEQALGEEVERLKERIRRLGEVNTGAIDEYEETKKRFDHLVSERTDLERSIENLEEAIEHINKTSEERFKRAFEAIQDRFERLFPIIFGGGSAHLSLVYPEGSTDILEAGVDILAQPPGKKVSNITLLSGGEKALTAVSLIFAIFMVKPSPFCVLDEVDAPLDDANIGKFNALLREMAAKSQFILITHNKKTMELNDTLYGVTMEEPGVSKMISIEMQ